ncbi:MAG: hypothetical protein CM1200mP26_08000 [Acidimicrobiales bacterium]|nr:MAG: hypothetical protein CM1200mP26_08000 [Acidimicrobiales bacterium]
MGWHLAAHLSDSDAVDELAVFDVVDGLASRWADENSGEVADSVTSAVTGAGVHYHLSSCRPGVTDRGR